MAIKTPIAKNFTMYDYGGNRNGTLPSTPLSSFALPVALTTAGRVGFYVDYSELATTGTHNFYICRTHGTTGDIWVNYESFGDAHTNVTGVIHWADGDASIKTLPVVVPTKADAGDHRMYVQLSNASTGAELHNGVNTIAHGVIDDGTIATTNALFIDADSVSNGVGTEGDPFNNWYTARAAVVAGTRYLYIKGMMVPDGTDTVAMSETVRHLNMGSDFAGRTSESERLYIMGWPGFTGGIDGGAQTNVAGFACDTNDGVTGSVDYLTIRKLSFTNLDNADGGSATGKSYFLRTRGAPTETITNWTAEIITLNGINSGANAAVAAWYTEGGLTEGTSGWYKIWRWSASNLTHQSVANPLNAYEGYRTENVSIQRCTSEATAGGWYEKQATDATNTVGMSLRFNRMHSNHVRWSTQGTSPPQDFHIFQSNILSGYYSLEPPLRIDATAAIADPATKHHISNNIIYDIDFSTLSGLTVDDAGLGEVILYNNIYLNVDQPWDFKAGVDQPEYVDYNCYYYSGGSLEFNINSTQYTSLALLQAGEASTAQNAVSTDPLVTNPAGEVWTLDTGSPSIAGGQGGTDQGVYLTGIEVIGA